MIARVVHPYNLQKALEQVIAKRGSAGVDGVKVSQLKERFPNRKPQLLDDIAKENYLSQPILGVEIPKGNGKVRLLGVPTTTDRVLQQAVSQVIAPLFETEFSSNSFGFRPNKNARQAVGQSRDYIHQGLNHIVDIDLKNFFDEVDHCLLLNLVYRKVKCKTTMRLIRKWLRAPIQIKGKLQKRRKGVPQGSPLSPLLSNILLHELDKEMTRRKYKFVRYADDFSIYCTSDSTSACKVLENEAKTDHQRGEKRDKTSRSLYYFGIWICANLQERKQERISVSSGRKGLEETQRKT